MTHPSRQAMMDKAIADRKRITDWLLPHVARGEKAFTKDQYRQLATNDLGPISKAAFDFAWVSAIEQTGRHDWYLPRPRKKDTKQ